MKENTQGIHVPAGCADAYKAEWTEWADYIEPDAHNHTFAKEWSYDENNHWHAATCEHTGEISDKAAHSYGEWTVTKEATESAAGSRERSCTACGYKKTEVIPPTGTGSSDSGKIETDKEQGENTPDIDFGTSEDDLISAVLTPEEQGLMETGTDVKIILEIDNIDASVSPFDQQAVTDKAAKRDSILTSICIN